MYNTPATPEEIQTTIAALKANGINAILATDGADAKAKALAMIPSDASVMTMTSVTLTQLGIADEINNSGKYNSVRTQFTKMDHEKHRLEMRAMAAAPEYTIGSVSAVTQDGKVLIGSNTGSQLPAYVYGAHHVIWVVGTQKITKDVDDAVARVYGYVLPLESERANKAYNITTGTNLRKLLLINSEGTKDRITLIFVPEVLGF